MKRKNTKKKKDAHLKPLPSNEYDFDKVTFFIILAVVVAIIAIVKIVHIGTERNHIGLANRKLAAVQTQLDTALPNGKLQRHNFCAQQPTQNDPDKTALYCGVEITGTYSVRSLATSQAVQEKIAAVMNAQSLNQIAPKNLLCGYSAGLPPVNDATDAVWPVGQQREVTLTVSCQTKATLQYYSLERK
jgi:hypothetical protein